MHDETRVPFSTVDGTGPRQPPKIVIHSSNRRRSDASFQAVSGSRSDDTETSTRAKSCRSSRAGGVIARDAHTRARRTDKPGIWLYLGFLRLPALVQAVCYIDDLRGLRLRLVDFVGDVVGDEAPDLTIDTCQDAQYLAAKGLRRHIDGDVRRPRFCHVDNQEKRLGGSPRGARGGGSPGP